MYSWHVQLQPILLWSKQVRLCVVVIIVRYCYFTIIMILACMIMAYNATVYVGLTYNVCSYGPRNYICDHYGLCDIAFTRSNVRQKL